MLFTNGASPVPYLNAYGIQCYRTGNAVDAHEAQAQGILAPLYDVYPSQDQDKLPAELDPKEKLKPVFNGQVVQHYVFDLDGVVFNSESETVFQQEGLTAYYAYETKKRSEPIPVGPAFGTLKTLSNINALYQGHHKPFKLSVVTARAGVPAIRAIETLHHLGVDINGEAPFLKGGDKQPILEIMRQRDMEAKIATEFLDDQPKNVEKGREVGILAGQIANDLFLPTQEK